MTLTYGPPAQGPALYVPQSMVNLQRSLDREDAERRNAAYTHVPMPSTYMLLPALTAVLPASLVVWIPGILSSSAAVTLVGFFLALYVTRRAFALQMAESPRANVWDAATWRIPIMEDFLMVTLTVMVLLATTASGFVFSTIVFTASTWVWLTARGVAAARRSGKSGRGLAVHIWRQWKARNEKYQRR